MAAAVACVVPAVVLPGRDPGHHITQAGVLVLAINAEVQEPKRAAQGL